MEDFLGGYLLRVHQIFICLFSGQVKPVLGGIKQIDLIGQIFNLADFTFMKNFPELEVIFAF